MPDITQANRPITVETPLGRDKLLFGRMSAREALSRPFEFELELLSEDHDIKLEKVLGQPMTVYFELPDKGRTRHFNGICTHFSYTGPSSGLGRYRAVLRPWFWLLTRTTDSRIFQNKTVPDIVKKVFDDQGFGDFEDRLSGSYREWEYCVQYRESDFNFISRLLELEGIYYYFLHEDGKHTLVLSDPDSAHDKVADYEEVPYYRPDQGARRERDHISDWSVARETQPGRYTLRDFDFVKPKAELEARIKKDFEHPYGDFEVYDYPGGYFTSGDGKTYAEVRLEELHAQYERARGMGDAGGLATGALFQLVNYPRDDQNREYLILSTEMDLASDAYESGGGGEAPHCRIGFTALDGKVPFRPARATPKPAVQGPQTAMVVGPSGEEIWTDEHGRVKVQFPWDREGKEDENSSCWVRVSQPWAGKGWGAVAIPRIGQEVIVDFIEGDPDRPIVTGRVYNGEAKAPYDLPANATQTGIKSRSSKGGTGDNFNEIRFEDKKGEEQVYIHAEKNQDIVVENDETHSVGHDRTKTIDNDETTHVKHDRTETVDNNETITIGVNRTESVGTDETISIGNNRTEDVGVDESITIGSNRTENVGADESITIGSNRTENVGADESITIGSNRTENVGADETITIGANRTEEVGDNETVSIGGNRSHDVGDDDSLSVGKKLSISAGDQITLSTGSASIVMKKNGDIAITGKNITIKGSGNVVIKGQKILQN